jgi:parallel beta-helix repeat protein
MTLRKLVPQKLNTQIIILGTAFLLALPTGMAEPPEAKALPAEKGAWQEIVDTPTPAEIPTETPPPVETSDETLTPAETPTETSPTMPPPDEAALSQYPPGQWATVIENQDFTQPLQLEAGMDNTLILNATFHDIAGSALMLSNVSNIYIKNCTIYNVAEDGIVLRSTGSAHNVTIEGCIIYNTGRSGILAQPGEVEDVEHTNLVIKNNTLYDNGTTELDHGIDIFSTDSLVENNIVHGSSGNGISLRSSGIVRGNRVWDTQKSCIGYASGHAPGASNAMYIENNVCYQMSSGLGSPGIGLSQGEQTSTGGLVQDYHIRFNTVVLATADRFGFMVEAPEFEPNQVAVYGNVFVNTGTIFKTVNPQYVDRISSNYNTTYLEEFVNTTQPPYDFQLTSASLAHAYASTELQFPSIDINGNVRTGGALDAGAYQSPPQPISDPTPIPDLAPIDAPAPETAPIDVPAPETAPIDVPAPEVAPIDAPASEVAPIDAPADSSTHDHSMMAVAAVSGNSHAMGLWVPTSRDTCTQAQHDAYFVVGPDGKNYPTWHPPTGPGGCTFGHEHGRDPRQSPNWAKIQEYFAYDANQNGIIEASEKAQAGVPFGYVNEQLDLYNSAKGTPSLMRHEDHVGHKIEWEAQGEIRVHGGPGTTNIRVVARCNYFAKVHQGTHSKDAFSNNLHEVFVVFDCPSENYDIRIAKMVAFGAAGEFSKSPPCSPRGGIQFVGFDSSNSSYFGSRSLGSREIGHRECANQNFLVPQGRFSSSFYEIWIGNTSIWLPSGQTLVRNPVPQFAVFDPIRFYDPGKPNNLGYLIDLCYETEANGDKARGIPCDQVQGKPRLTWDNPASVFKGTKRETYFQAGPINNANGPVFWYTDPYGANAQRTPFPGSVKQYIINKNIDLGSKYQGVVDTSAYGASRPYAGNGVHAPN